MNLRSQRRLSVDTRCEICFKLHGAYAVFWPQEQVSDREIPKWRGYLKFELGMPQPQKVQGMRSKHTTLTVCIQHFELLYQNWVQIARDEVDLDRAWNQYIERTEG